MKLLPRPFRASVWLLPLLASSALAGPRERVTVEAAADSLAALSAIPLSSIPPALMADARGVAIVPNVVKASFVLGVRLGRGVVLVRKPDGSWSNPVFVTLAGGGIGFQVGIQSTDVVLVFKTAHSLDRILRGQGKLTLGGDAAVAAGPIGRQATAATDGQLQAEIYSYSRSRGLFAGVSLEGAGLVVDGEANEAFYGVRGGFPGDVLALPATTLPGVEGLKAQLLRMSAPPPPPPPVLLAPQAVPPPPPQGRGGGDSPPTNAPPSAPRPIAVPAPPSPLPG
jgi:lipid-binding SYLF domain-containing protein